MSRLCGLAHEGDLLRRHVGGQEVIFYKPNALWFYNNWGLAMREIV